MLSSFENSGNSYENIDFSGANIYQLYLLKQESYQADEPLQNKVTKEIDEREHQHSSGNDIFRTMFHALETKDTDELAWSMSYLTNLIHVNSMESDKEKLVNLNIYQKSDVFDPYNTWLTTAKSWINNKVDTPLGFASATEAQRIYLNIKGTDKSFIIPNTDLAKYERYEVYYESLLDLFNINIKDAINNSKNGIYHKELENVIVDITVNENNKITFIRITKRL